MTEPKVVHVIPDKLGGAMNIVASLLAFREPDEMPHEVVLTHNTMDRDTRFGGTLRADAQTTVEYALPVENIYAVLRRLRQALPDGGGVLVCHDLLELAMLHRYDPGMMVVQIAHGDYDYYYELAMRHQAVIDVFVGYSKRVCEELQRRLPARASDVLYLPYGVPPAARRRTPRGGSLRLVFAGRLDTGKGIFDLPVIDRLLAERGVGVEWTIIGGGPDGAALQELWKGSHVRWTGALPHREVLATLPDADVFVLPTRAEGFPVALVEAMACGLVPVVSDIPSGVPEVVDDGRNGFRPPVGDVARASPMRSRPWPATGPGWSP